ncbi:MAG: hypothetical protein ACN4GT_09975 [Gammaproteobacteria bacterium]
MKRISTYLACISGAMTLAFLAGPTTADSEGVQASDHEVIVTDFSGRPPFSRTRVPARETAEFAQLEEQLVSASTRQVGEKVQIVDYSGRPPYSRRVVVLDETEVAEFARFEDSGAASDSPHVRRSAPGKIRSRR